MRYSDYTHVKICPYTKEQLTEHEYAYSHGVCPRCGTIMPISTFTHHEKIVGRFLIPNLFERIFLRKKTKFIPKNSTTPTSVKRLNNTG